MQGTIRNRDVLIHSLTILWHFGFFAYMRCMRSLLKSVLYKDQSTFLDALYAHPHVHPQPHPNHN
ncbi:MAG: hypothetical protein JW841_10145 [Deltaproteobacteria bacterium]|nr:hypothetical protein [Deltaproteobacteria bacterium]